MNSKKLFPEKKASKKGLVEFLDRKGFYVVLILCIAIIGVTAVFITTNNLSSPSTDFSDKIIPEDSSNDVSTDMPSLDDNKDKDEKPADASSVTTDKSGDVKAAVNTTPIPNADKNPAGTDNGKKDTTNTQGNTQSSSSTTDSDKKPASQSTTRLSLPVFGHVTFDYAMESLAYSKTLEEWRAHSGVDMAADIGTPVKAAANGIVADIKHDPGIGFTVIIDHQNGIKTVYANLAESKALAPNQKVKAGEVIGSVGNTAAFEINEATHLHFEVWKNNQPVDPSGYLPKENKK